MEVENYCHFYTMHTKIRQCGNRPRKDKCIIFCSRTQILRNITLCLKITQNVAFEFFSFGIFQHFLAFLVNL